MKIAYIILAHKNVDQIRCLLEAIQGDNVEIYLHLDRLAGKQFYKEAIIGLSGIKNLTILQRYATNWGSFGLVNATLNGIRQVVISNNAEYVILLSGQDLPVKPQSALVEFFEANFGKSYMEYFQLPHPKWKDHGGYDRITKWYFRLPIRKTWLSSKIQNAMFHFMNLIKPDRKFPEGFVPFGGSQWWCLHKDCIIYIDDFCRKNEPFLRFFNYVRIPDELFFQTILLNSPYANSVVNRNLTFVDWNGPPSPRVLSESELLNLSTSDYYFARKFNIVGGDIIPN